MSLLAEKMEKAGVDTVGAQLTQVCLDAIREGHRDPVKAWRRVGELFGHEFVMRLMADMGRSLPVSEARDNTPQEQYQRAVDRVNRTTDREIAAAPYKPRVIPKERLESRRKQQEIVRSKFKNSSGIAWSDVGWHELPVLARDGREAAALLAAGPAHAPNDGRSVGAVLGVKQVDLIIGSVRA
jgi:hypothetical protein